MLEGFFAPLPPPPPPHTPLLGKRVSRFKCQNVALLCLGVVILFLSKEFHGFVSHFQEFSYQRYFQVLSFCLLEGFKVSKVCFIIFRCSLSVFSSPVRSTRRAIVVTPVVHVCVCVCSCSRHTALKFFKCLYLNSHSSQRHQIWNLGTLEGLLRFQENKPLGSCPWVGLGVRI